MEIINNFQDEDVELDVDLIERYLKSKQREVDLNLDKVEKINKLLESAAFAIKGCVVLSGLLIFFYYLPVIINLFN